MSPTFMLHEHELYSGTCGTDFVDIDSSMKRPITIGVYGHPSHLRSEYVMKVIFYENFDKSPEDMSDYLPGDLQEWRYNVTDILSDKAELDEHQSRSSLVEIAEILFSILTFLIELVLEVLV